MKKTIILVGCFLMLAGVAAYAGDVKPALKGPDGGTSGYADAIPSLENGDLIITSTNDDARFGDSVMFYVNDEDSNETQVLPHTIDSSDGGNEDLELANVYTGNIFGVPAVVEVSGATTLTQCEDVLNVTYIFTAAATLTLPDIATCQEKGRVTIYVRDSSETAIVDTNGNDEISNAGTAYGAGDCIENSTTPIAGDMIVLQILDGNYWYVIDSNGDWSDGGPS